MRLALAALLAVAAAAPAQPVKATTDGKLVEETWLAASFDSHHAGYMRTTVYEYDVRGTKVYRAARETNLTVRRFGQAANIRVVSGTDELAAGQVVGIFMTQALGANIDQKVVGKVEGDRLNVIAEGKQPFQKAVPWRGDVVGVWGETRQLALRKPKPGDSFEYYTFEPIINAVVRIRAKAEAMEAVTVGNQRPTLLRLSMVPDAIADVQLPGALFWVDADYKVVRSTNEMPGMGRLVLERATAAEAQQPVSANVPDIGLGQSIILKQAVAQPFDARQIVWRVSLPNESGNVTAMFSNDARQQVVNVNDAAKTLDLKIGARRTPPAQQAADAKEAAAEFLGSNYFITSDDARVQQHSRAAVNGASDPWDKARAVERWVNANMRAMNFTEAMAPADHVAKTLQGDCTEYAMLAAAMCRAAGVPSRTAIGLVYVDAAPPRPPMLGFHMWTEVYVRGEWVGLDATLGRGGVGPGHLKISDHSWHDVRTMTPTMPLMRVMMAKPAIEVAAVAK